MKTNKQIVLNSFSAAHYGRQPQKYSCKNFFNSFVFLFLTGLFVLLQSANAANYYWVGNAGNWKSVTHWASSSGGAGSAYGTPPKVTDNVYFDANSITSAGQTITIDTNAYAANMTFSGVLNSPTLTGTNAYAITCAGSLTLVAGMTYTFAGDVNFTGTGANNVTSAGKTFLRNVLFNSSGGTYTLQDNIIVTSQLGLQSGTLNLNSKSVSCGTLNANIVDNVRVLDFTGSTVTITGSGTALDLRGNTSNLTISSTSVSAISFTNSGAITTEVGSKAKTIPNISFPNCVNTIRMNSGTVASTTERITYRDITVSQTGGYFYLDNLSVNTNQKTFANLTIAKPGWISGTNGTAFGAADVMIITGNVIAPNLDPYGAYAELQGNLTQTANGDGSDWRYAFRVLGNVTITGTGSTYVHALEDMQILGNVNVNIGTGALDNFIFTCYKTSLFNGVTTLANSVCSFVTTATANTMTFSGTITAGNGSRLTMGNSNACTLSIGTLTCGSNTFINIIPATTGTTSTISNLNLGAWSFLNLGSTFSGTFIHAIGTIAFSGSCTGWTVLTCTNKLYDAKITFSSTQNVSYVVCSRLNVTTANLNNTGGKNLSSSNTGITFIGEAPTRTYYWVGGLAANTKLGTYSTGVNNNWSNPDNWSTASGSYPGNNQCSPGPQDNVIFDANSFTSATNKTCEFDLWFAFVNNMTWSGVTAGCFFDQTATSTSRSIYIYGNLIFAGANMTNSFEGTFRFEATSAKTITCNGTRFYGPLYFNDPLGSWSLVDNVNVDGDSRADITVNHGSVSANAVTINLEGDFATVANVPSVFSCGKSTLIFDGSTTNTYDETLNLATGDPLYNLTISRVNGTGTANRVYNLSAVTVNNNLIITGGWYWDNGYQITGNATGVLTNASGARFWIGNTTNTMFPPNFTYPHITLDPASIVCYYGAGAQTVSGLPDYGILQISSADNSAYKNKTLSETVLINTGLYMMNYTNFIDNGFQISFDAAGPNVVDMQVNTKFTLGSAAVITTFPVNYTAASVNFIHTGNGSTVIYNSGLNQTIEALFGAGNASYSHLTLTNSPAAVVTKVLNNNTIIRGNLYIDVSNEMDVTAANYSITIGGNWTDLGSFTERLGMVTFNGSALQTISAGAAGAGTETYYDATFNNTVAPTAANGSITLASDITINHSATFTDGVVCANPTTKITTIIDNATVSGASSLSFVDGKVRKIGNEAFVYPTGDNINKYAPIAITTPSLTTDHFTAQYFNNSPNSLYSRALKDDSLNHVSSAEYWILDRTNGTSNITPTLYWDSPRSGGVANLSLLRVTKWNGSKWIDLGAANTTGNTTAGTLQPSNVVTSFSPFTFATDESGDASDNPLPIELINFTAKAVDNKYTQLEWTTSTETNNDYFTVERSRDGIRNFEQVAKVKGAGNSSQLLKYSAQDMSPLSGLSYYRLKQTDFDGKYTYSQLEAVEFNGLQEAFYIFPNPTTLDNPTQMHLVSSENEEVLVVVYDISGKQYFSKIEITQNSGENVFALDLNQTLSRGVYYIVATTKDTIYKKKLVIQ